MNESSSACAPGMTRSVEIVKRSIRQPREGPDLAQAAPERRPGLAAVGAAVELTERGGGKDEIGIGGVDGQPVARAFDLARQSGVLPVRAAVAAAPQPPAAAGRSVAV